MKMSVLHLQLLFTSRYVCLVVVEMFCWKEISLPSFSRKLLVKLLLSDYYTTYTLLYFEMLNLHHCQKYSV